MDLINLLEERMIKLINKVKFNIVLYKRDIVKIEIKKD